MDKNVVTNERKARRYNQMTPHDIFQATGELFGVISIENPLRWGAAGVNDELLWTFFAMGNPKYLAGLELVAKCERQGLCRLHACCANNGAPDEQVERYVTKYGLGDFPHSDGSESPNDGLRRFLRIPWTELPDPNNQALMEAKSAVRLLMGAA